MTKYKHTYYPLFIITHYYQSNKLYLKGQILEGLSRDNCFYIEYEEITIDTYKISTNNEADICFNFNGKYFHLSICIGKDIHSLGISQDIENNFIIMTNNLPNGEFRYSTYMNEVAYIIMSGMILTGI